MENDPIRAAHYYNICLNLDFDEYREAMIEKFLHLDGERTFFYGDFGFLVPYPAD